MEKIALMMVTYNRLNLTKKTIDNIVAIRIMYERTYGDERIIKSLEQLDFNYDDGFGGQELYGYVLLDDQDWLERHEYDGSEWWEYKKYPSHLLEEVQK